MSQVWVIEKNSKKRGKWEVCATAVYKRRAMEIAANCRDEHRDSAFRVVKYVRVNAEVTTTTSSGTEMLRAHVRFLRARLAKDEK